MFPEKTPLRIAKKCFPHYKPVMYQSRLIDWPVRYPPFRGWKLKLMKFITRR